MAFKDFDFQSALCFCCSTNHVDPDGEQMLCDRQILGKCIVEWFGSIANFEEQVRRYTEERGLDVRMGPTSNIVQEKGHWSTQVDRMLMIFGHIWWTNDVGVHWILSIRNVQMASRF